MRDDNIIYLDLTNCKSYFELHERIKSAFDFPDWYGCNWDAFYDLLRTDVSANRIIIKGEYTIAAGLQDELKTMHKVLELAKQYNLHILNEIFTYEITS